MTTNPLARPDATFTWLDVAIGGFDPTEFTAVEMPGPTDAGPDPDLGDAGRGRSALAYVLPSPTGKPLRWRTYLALHSARAHLTPTD